MICGLPSPKLSIRGQPFVALVKREWEREWQIKGPWFAISRASGGNRTSASKRKAPYSPNCFLFCSPPGAVPVNYLSCLTDVFFSFIVAL